MNIMPLKRIYLSSRFSLFSFLFSLYSSLLHIHIRGKRLCYYFLLFFFFFFLILMSEKEKKKKILEVKSRLK